MLVVANNTKLPRNGKVLAYKNRRLLNTLPYLEAGQVSGSVVDAASTNNLQPNPVITKTLIAFEINAG